MFKNCSSLNEIKIDYIGDFYGTGVLSNAFNKWVQGVSASGTFYYDGEDTTTGINAIPTGWDVRRIHSDLTIEARTSNVTIGSSR